MSRGNGNGLNLRNLNNVYRLAQGDDASTVMYEFLDQNNLLMATLDDSPCVIYLIKEGVIEYEYPTRVFDSTVEFNINKIIPPGDYKVEIVLTMEGFKYVFPSDRSAKIKIFESVLG